MDDSLLLQLSLYQHECFKRKRTGADSAEIRLIMLQEEVILHITCCIAEKLNLCIAGMNMAHHFKFSAGRRPEKPLKKSLLPKVSSFALSMI